MSLDICIFNSFNYHYEMFGYIIEYAISNGHNLDIYTAMENDYGWFDFYKNHFNFINFLPIYKFRDASHKYNLIILTTDYDPAYNSNLVDLYNNKYKTLVINHTIESSRRDLLYFADIRPYPFKNVQYCIPSFRYITTPKKFINKKLKIFVGVKPVKNYNWDYLEKLCKIHEIHVVCRNIPDEYKKLGAILHEKINTREMFDLMTECDFLFYVLEDCPYRNTKISGFIPMAFSCGTQILMDRDTNFHYGFTSCKYPDEELIPDSEKVLQERTRLEMLPAIIERFIPSKVESFSEIPKVINFIWLSKEGDKKHPDKYNIGIDTFKKHNPNWEIKIWNNSSIENLLKTKFSGKISDTYFSFKKLIKKCDFARMCILYAHGGIYSDLDFYCVKNLDLLIKDKTLYITEEIIEHEVYTRQLYNGFLASTRGNLFIYGWINKMVEIQNKSELRVMNSTGPIAFYNYWSSLKDKPELSNPVHTIPYVNTHKLSRMFNQEPDIYTYTLWNEGSKWSLPDYYIIFILFFLFLILIISAIIFYTFKK